MKNIALLHYAYSPAIGGVELVLNEHAKILTEMGYNLTVLTGSGAENNNEIQLTQIPEFQSIVNFNPALQEKINNGVLDSEFETLSKTISDKLEELLKNQDTIIVHNMASVSRNLAFMDAFYNYAQNHSDKNIIIYVHDHMCIGEGTIKNIDEVAKSPLEKKLLTAAYPNCTYMTISNTVKKLLAQVIGVDAENIHVIPNGINIKDFLEIDDSIWEYLKGNYLPDKFPVILSPVNILERKNLIYTIDVVAELKKAFPNIYHIITGAPSKHRGTEVYFTELKRHTEELGIQDNTIFMADKWGAALKQSELHDLYSLSDLVFYFSKSENFGLPILEAGLNRNPIFTSNLEVFHEIQGEFGRYFDIEAASPSQIAEEIKTFLQTDKTVLLQYKIRTEYSLRKLMQNHLVPLL